MYGKTSCAQLTFESVTTGNVTFFSIDKDTPDQRVYIRKSEKLNVCSDRLANLQRWESGEKKKAHQINNHELRGFPVCLNPVLIGLQEP